MKRLWLYYFPLIFLPNLGFASATSFGTLEFSDLLIVPYIGLLLVAVRWRDKRNVGQLKLLFGLFVAWALLSTLTIPFRYDWSEEFHMNVGLLKIAKMVLYGTAGVLTASALRDERSRRDFDWSLLAAATICGLSLWYTEATVQNTLQKADRSLGYSATNGISVMSALLIVYLGGKYLTGNGSALWRKWAPVALIVTIAGAAVSDGRGGWVAAIAGGFYILYRLGPRREVLYAVAAAVVVVASLYQTQPEFKRQVDLTLFMPEQGETYEGTRNVGPLDDGARFETWDHEARKLIKNPVLGTGMFHRGGQSGLWSTGSHNFWIQMYLELGIVGGTLIILILVRMWKQASSQNPLGGTADLPLKTGLIAAFIGGLSGEYFYGGIILFTLFAIYAQTGSLRVEAMPIRLRSTERVFKTIRVA